MKKLIFISSLFFLFGCGPDTIEGRSERAESRWKDTEYKGHIYIEDFTGGPAIAHAGHCPCWKTLCK